jgi:hypothetical protein
VCCFTLLIQRWSVIAEHALNAPGGHVPPVFQTLEEKVPNIGRKSSNVRKLLAAGALELVALTAGERVHAVLGGFV